MSRGTCGFMSKKETDLAGIIREKTRELLLVKEPEEITTRDIAAACGVTATSIYYYYKDRDALFNAVKLSCLKDMDAAIGSAVMAAPDDILSGARAALCSFRDWAFDNPRMAVLLMGRFKADTAAGPEDMEKYYRSTMFAKTLLDKARAARLSDSRDTMLDASLCIASLWGAIEGVLLKRTIPEYWDKGVEFTDKMIDTLLSTYLHKKGKKR